MIERVAQRPDHRGSDPRSVTRNSATRNNKRVARSVQLPEFERGQQLCRSNRVQLTSVY